MKEIIEKFYNALDNLDAETMVSCYHDDVTFEDPAFGRLHGERAKNMWRMLCKSQDGKHDNGFKAKCSQVTDHSAFVQAEYTFTKTGRHVHNKIHAKFEFKDGLIIKQTDHFDLHRWARQALDFSGAVLGWSGYFKKKLQQTTNRMLDKFEKHQ